MVWLLLLAILLDTVHAGGLWPEPRHQEFTSRVLYLKPEVFKLRVTGRGSELLTDALARYETILWDAPPYASNSVPTLERLGEVEDHIASLAVHVAFSDQSLSLNTDESYELQIDAPEAVLKANTVFGALRGLQTFSQAVERIDLPPGILLPSKAAEALMAPASKQSQRLNLLGQVLLPSMFFKPPINHHRHKKHHKRHKKHHKHGKKRHKKHHHKHDKHHKRSKSFWVVNATTIKDAPRFHHRGLLIDTARHFLPVSVILAHLNAMEQCKLNVLHWHITDDQSFPYQSDALPLLAKSGAFAPEAVYTAQDIAEVVDHARALGIRVIPELDTPGHTLSWGRGDYRLLTACHDSNGVATGKWGPLDPSQQHTYTVLWKLLRELATRFPDSYVHLGGDEVHLDCWENNPKLRAWMADNNMTSVAHLEQHYVKRLLSLAHRAERSYVVWQEVFDSGLHIANDTIVQVWKWFSGDSARTADKYQSSRTGAYDTELSSSGSRAHLRSMQCELSSGCRGSGPPGDGGWAQQDEDTAPYLMELQNVTKQGYRALLSAPWYLNLGSEGASNWAAYYTVEPVAFKGTKAQHDLVIGGEAAMWGEYTDASNSLSKTWPDAAAVAERLWSPPAHARRTQALPIVQKRLEEHRCRMLARGSAASPIGPGFCPADPVYKHLISSAKGAASLSDRAHAEM